MLVRQSVNHERKQSHEYECCLLQCRYNLMNMLNVCLSEDGKVLLATNHFTEYCY